MRILLSLAALVGGATVAQFPEFFQQYLQRLGGRLDLARERVQEISIDAASQGIEVTAYIDLFTASPVHVQEGRRMAQSIDEATRLQEAHDALTSAAAWEALPRMLHHLDLGIAGQTANAFQPALPISTAGILYACIGGLVGLLVAVTTRSGFRKIKQIRPSIKKVAQ